MVEDMGRQTETLPVEGRQRVVIEGVSPLVDGGRFPARSSVGEVIEVSADIFADGHDLLTGVIQYRHETEIEWHEAPLVAEHNDRWSGSFLTEKEGRYFFCVAAWVNPFRTWQRDLLKKAQAGQELEIEFEIGAGIIQRAIQQGKGSPVKSLLEAAEIFSGQTPADTGEKLATALQPNLADEFEFCLWRPHFSRFTPEIPIVVDSTLARFSAWYEFFPRSCSHEIGRHGTFSDCLEWLPRIAKMGFNVVYFPPIHPIGKSYRKGKNNALTAGPEDPGSPWAIGSPEGGHKAIHPQLGTIQDFWTLVQQANGLGMEVALDIAFQCSPDHPYVKEHPEWFYHRPDGSIQYAENPPKKYQDIYPLNFECEQWESLWLELRSVFEFWMDQGIKVFRVDNPHTKSFRFWEWCLNSLREKNPRLIFLSEAFTRPKLMKYLAKAGFNQSYNYFPWRNTRKELTEYLTELTHGESRHFLRANLWPNTPDILTQYLQHGGKPAFVARLILAATLGASYGVYGPPYEHCLNRAREEGSEEYLDSEKYQLNQWYFPDSHGMGDLMALLNRIRQDNPALQFNDTLKFHKADSDQLIVYSKHRGENIIITVVNLDPHNIQRGWVTLDLSAWGISPTDTYQVHELLTEARYLWTGATNYVELSPAFVPAHVFRLRKYLRTEDDFD
jgi:starch synthase (maltosyl-transferring)